MAQRGRPRKNAQDAREDIEKRYDEQSGVAPEDKEETALPSQEEEQPTEQAEGTESKEVETPQAQPVEEPQKRKFAGKFESEDELEQGYLNAEKKMHESSQKSSALEQEFTRLKRYIDWDKVKQAESGIPPKKERPKMDKEVFFNQLGEKGPDFMDEYIAQSPALQQQIESILPVLTQSISFRVRLDDAYSTFRDQYPHLVEWEDRVGKLMLDDLAQNPQKSLGKAMHDAAKSVQERLDTFREQSKREAQILHEEKKSQTLPPGDRASKERMGTGKPKSQEEVPETLDDYIRDRRKVQELQRSKVGYYKQK